MKMVEDRFSEWLQTGSFTSYRLTDQEIDAVLDRIDAFQEHTSDRRNRSHFIGIKHMKEDPHDRADIKHLILLCNHKIHSYNRLGGEFVKVAQSHLSSAANDSATRPVKSLRGALKELLRLRSRANEGPSSTGYEEKLQNLDRRMRETLNGPEGILALQREIAKKRNG